MPSSQPSSHVVLDQVDVAFNDERAVASAGLLLPATLAERLGIEQITDKLVDLGDRPGRARPGRKLLTLVHALVAGGDCIDDVVRREAPCNRVGCKSPPPACRSRPVKLGAA
jgi:hypothetical protein